MNVRDSSLKTKIPDSISLVQAIAETFEGRRAQSVLPKGIREIERATVEALRIEFNNKIDEELLSQLAEEEGFTVQKGSFPLRVTKTGAIVARVGSKSDIGGQFDLYVYLFPPEMEKISIYRRLLAEREGIIHPDTGKINLGEFHKFNLNAVRLVSRYLKEKQRHKH